MGVENLGRAAWAAAALEAFCKVTGQNYKTERQEAIRDLICDLLHLAAFSDCPLKLVEIHGKAWECFTAEVHDDE